MRAKSMVLILIALGCGLVASIAISQVLERGANSGGSGLETVQIYVAMSDIDVNEELSAANVRVEDWPKTKVPEGSISILDEIENHFARARLYEGEPILNRMLADEISVPAVKIPDGHRVCSINVKMDTAVSYLIKPGDRVDIFAYFKKTNDIPTTGTRQILSNVRVFAINSETDQGMDDEGKAIVAKTVSVLVKQKQVARLMLATELGVLRLSLRHPNEVEIENAVAETASIESLFGSRAESADEADDSNGPSQLASTATGVMSFLAGLKQPAPQGAMQAIATAPSPVWQMTILTPDGGEEFTWTDANGLPTLNSGGISPTLNRPGVFPGVSDAWQPVSEPSDATTPDEGSAVEPEQEDDLAMSDE